MWQFVLVSFVLKMNSVSVVYGLQMIPEHTSRLERNSISAESCEVAGLVLGSSGLALVLVLSACSLRRALLNLALLN